MSASSHERNYTYPRMREEERREAEESKRARRPGCRRKEPRVARDEEQTIREFEDLVNMSPWELEDWLATEESKSVGEGGEESKGHASGRRIVEIERKKTSDYTDEDLAHMRNVTGYIKRHLAQKPTKNDARDSKWRYSLMNWGHDPLK